jgi:transposase
MAALRDHGPPLVDNPARLQNVGAVGVDETAFTAATATSPTEFVTGIVDLTRRRGGVARLLDVVEGHSAEALQLPDRAARADWRATVVGASLNPYRGYAAALRTGLPEATRVLDALSRHEAGVRRRRGPSADPAGTDRAPRPPRGSVVPDPAGARCGYDHHTERSWPRPLAGLDAGDTADEQLAKTWIAAQELRLALLGAACTTSRAAPLPGHCHGIADPLRAFSRRRGRARPASRAGRLERPSQRPARGVHGEGIP